MSLINQVLADLEKRRGALPPTAQITLSGLTVAERSPAPEEPQTRRMGLLLLLLLLASALLIKGEALLERLSISSPVGDRTAVAVNTSPQSARVDASARTMQGTPARDSANLPTESSPTAPITAPASAAAGELTQLAAGKEGSGVALQLHLTSPVHYALETDPKGKATLRLANVRLREGYLQAFNGDGPIHDVQVRHGDGDEVDVRFSPRVGVSTGNTEITAADDGGYLLLVHFNNDGAPGHNPAIPASSLPRLAATPMHTAEPHSRAGRSQGHPPVIPEGKRKLAAQKTPAPVTRADAAGGETAVVENERPGVFHKIPRAAEPIDPKTRLYEAAATALRNGDRAQALALGRQALEADPMAVAPRLLVATVLMEGKHPAEARVLLETGLSQAPGNRDYKLLYARLLSEGGEAGKAIELLTRDAPAPAADPDYHAVLAALLQRTGRHDGAIASYRQLLAVQPQNGLWWMGLGISLSAAGQREQARDAFNHALADQNLSDRLRQFLNDQLQQLQKAST